MSTTATKPTPSLKALGFTPLTPTIHLLTPPSLPTSPPTSPTTILLCAWLNAPPRPLLHYITHHRTSHPTSMILLLLSTPRAILLTPYASQRHVLAPAVTALRRAPGVVLAHVFSNGGANSFVRLCEAYKEVTGELLPLAAVVLDSAPGSASLVRSTRPLVHELPAHPLVRWLGTAVVWIMVAVAWALVRVVGAVDVIEEIRRGLNDKALVRGEAGRTYVYSREDVMVDWREVERHAVEAGSRGWKVRLERWKGTDHVGHARGDRERYWRVVEGLWEEESKRETGVGDAAAAGAELVDL